MEPWLPSNSLSTENGLVQLIFQLPRVEKDVWCLPGQRLPPKRKLPISAGQLASKLSELPISAPALSAEVTGLCPTLWGSQLHSPCDGEHFTPGSLRPSFGGSSPPGNESPHGWGLPPLESYYRVAHIC